jgi:hypothetical protein
MEEAGSSGLGVVSAGSARNGGWASARWVGDGLASSAGTEEDDLCEVVVHASQLLV